MEYVERRDGSLYLVGSRVPLAHVICEFQSGEAADVMRSHYPTLGLDPIDGAIRFYLGHKEEVEQDMMDRLRMEDEFVKGNTPPRELKEKLERVRELMLKRRI